VNETATRGDRRAPISDRWVPAGRSDIVVNAIATDVSNPLNFPGHVMQRAIRALGPKVNQSNIAIIVFGAVRARPTALFGTVRASIRKRVLTSIQI
jgi:hypothetical protein